MKDLGYPQHQSQFTSHSLASWDAVLEFLRKLQFRNGEEGEVHISRKDGKVWKVETDLSSEEKAVKLTTRWRGVGLFDLNW